MRHGAGGVRSWPLPPPRPAVKVARLIPTDENFDLGCSDPGFPEAPICEKELR